MKECTIVTTVELTDIIQRQDDAELFPKEKIAENIKELLQQTKPFDNVNVVNVQVFERDIDPEEEAEQEE